MKIKDLSKTLNNSNSIFDYPSGTVVEYGSDYGNNNNEIYGIGIILKDADCNNIIIYDINEDCYYSDCEKYYVSKVFDKKNCEFVVK